MLNNLFIKSAEIDWSKIDRDSYLNFIESIRSINNIEFNSPITIFSGENGSGKSTMLEAMAVASGFNPEGGTRNYNFSTYNSHSELHEALKVIRGVRRPKWGYFLRAESFYNVASANENYAQSGIGYSQSEELHNKSHGESFLAIAQKHFREDSLYFLDEPEAALSPQRQLTLLCDIYDCVNKGSQFFIVTHSPILLGIPGADILSFDNSSIRKIKYEDTDSYQITKMFIENREGLLNKLL